MSALKKNKIITKTSDIISDICFICEEPLYSQSFERESKLCPASAIHIVSYVADDFVRVNIDNYCFFYYKSKNELNIYNRGDNKYPNQLIYSGQIITLDFSDVPKLEEKLDKLVNFL